MGGYHGWHLCGPAASRMRTPPPALPRLALQLRLPTCSAASLVSAWAARTLVTSSS